MRNLLCFIRPSAQPFCAKTSPSRLFCGIFSRHLSGQSFVLAHQSYETKESQNEDTPVLIIHGMLGSKKNWHSFSKSYSEQTDKRVCVESLQYVRISWLFCLNVNYLSAAC
jgi:fluoride ion exporter CrcB/FEX